MPSSQSERMPARSAAASISSRVAFFDVRLLELVVHPQVLEDADRGRGSRSSSSARSRPCGRSARRRAPRPRSRLDAQRDQLVGRDLVRLGAVRAELAREPLREHGRDGRAGDERLDAHLVQARDRARGVVRVHRREDEVAGERGLDRDPRRLAVADLADHHDVGVGAEDRAQRGRERQAGARVDLHLVDARRAGTRPGPRR